MLIAFHGKTEVKAFYTARVRAHQIADEIIQGYGYWRDGRGCAVGCSIHGDSHSAYESEMGVPRLLAKLEDGMFEGMPIEDAKRWPLAFLEAIPVGADLSGVWPRFAHWLLLDEEHGVIKFANTDKRRAAIQAVGDLYGRVIAGEEVSREEWKAAAYAAAYAAYAAYAAADAAAADAAAYAADAADAAAADAAAYAAAADAAAYAAAAKQKARKVQSEKLLEFLQTAPVTDQVDERAFGIWQARIARQIIRAEPAPVAEG